MLVVRMVFCRFCVFEAIVVTGIILSASCNSTCLGQDTETKRPESQTAASETASLLSLSSGPIRLSIDPAVGGRIASMTFEGDEILRTKRDENNFHWGSSVWVSPQKNWGWPPSKVIDSDPYTVVSADEQKIVLRSKVDADTGYQITKRFEFNQKTKSPTPVTKMTYTVHNHTKESKKVALWENTRVHWDGVTRFAPGTKVRLSNPDQPAKLKSNEKVTSLQFNDEQPNAQKLFCTPPTSAERKFDWVSYRRGELLLVKSRKAPESVAPEQAPLEIYLAPKDDFAELEYQGEYVELGPGEKTSMVVLWRLQRADSAK